MIKLELINALLKRDPLPPRMGICEDFWPETIQQTWPAQGFAEDLDPNVEFDFDIVDLMEYWRNRRFAPSPFYNNWEVLEDDGEKVVHRSGWGTITRNWKHKNGTPEHLGFDLDSPEVWRAKYREPLLHLDVGRFKDIEGLKQRYRDYTDAGLFTMYNNTFIFENMRYSMGDVRMLEACFCEPDWVHDFCDVYTTFTILHVEYLFKEVGVPDGYTIYDDMAYTKAPFTSPELYRELFVPHLRRFTNFLKSYGVATIMHSCGNVEPQIENIIDAGIDCIQPLEAKTSIVLERLGQEYGDRLTFMGNIDIRALETNDPKQIGNEIVKKLDIVRRNRIPYIFHTDHSVSPVVTVNSYRHALNVFRANCWY